MGVLVDGGEFSEPGGQILLDLLQIQGNRITSFPNSTLLKSNNVVRIVPTPTKESHSGVDELGFNDYNMDFDTKRFGFDLGVMLEFVKGEFTRQGSSMRRDLSL